MAIQFDPNALRIFSCVDFGDDDAIANLGGEDNLVQKDKLGSFLWKPFRSKETEKRNNAVRTELLKALGQAFNLDGVTEQGGKTTFSDEFMDRLSDLLGPAFKRDDFGIKDGAVASGKPLTQRRITSIFKAAASVNAETSYDPKTSLAKAESIKVQSAPQIDGEDEIESSIDDDEDEEWKFQYATPDYVSGLPRETKVAFMLFYCTAVKNTIEDGGTKEECDNTLRNMFKEVGDDQNDRKLLAELLAGGKPRFLDEDGRLPFGLGADRFAKDFKSVLDLTKHYRAKLPKAYGDIVADTILTTLKTGGRMFAADALEPIDADLCDAIAAVAKEIDAETLFAPPPGKDWNAKSLANALDAFRREAAEKCAAKLFKLNDSELMTKIKQDLLMSMVLAQGGAAVESLAEGIDDHGEKLARKYGMQDLLADIAPGLKYGAIE